MYIIINLWICFIQCVTIYNCHYFEAQIVLVWASWNLFKLALYSNDMSPPSFKYFQTFYFLGCLRFILAFPCSSYGIRHVFKKFWFLCDSFSHEPPETTRAGLFSHFFDLPNSSFMVSFH